ncbi:uncharacterized protein BXIN_2837 [Babesia sp. Xinjiang]|uniref:uncharacterized protein n=1 Tax=Babesia sp. Xinjiang TaxID=462227 RepID=UPI000A25AC75|nr:uncharacterized protein BXIN_2837 [Babesia sp. Xinjiang]ORM39363.1 hypothetical protein BXIN_2837 [Babesia sp. Xinjiang]
MPTNIIERNVTAYGATNQGTTPVTTLRPMLTQTFVANSPPKALPESGVNTATLLQREQNKCINAIPTTNYIKTQEIKQNPAHNSVNAYGIDNNIALENEPIQEQEETEYPHLALDLSKITNAYPKFEQTPKLKQHERHNITQTKETAPEARVAIGKPRHPYTAQFNDPVEKELEKWHNSHTSTIKWVRIKRGVYTADNQEVKLVKLNGGLYVKGAKNHSKLDHLPIDKFVQKVQNNIVS